MMFNLATFSGASIGIYITVITLVSICLLVFLSTLLGKLKEMAKVKSENTNDSFVQNNFAIIATMFFLMVVLLCASLTSCIISVKSMATNYQNESRVVRSFVIADSIENEFNQAITVARALARDYDLIECFKERGGEPPKRISDEVANRLGVLAEGFDYQMTFAMCDESAAYYTDKGFSRYINPKTKPVEDAWYREICEYEGEYKLNDDYDRDSLGQLTTFVNVKMFDEDGNRIGVCGVGVDLDKTMGLIDGFERAYGCKILLVNSEGLVMMSSDIGEIELIQIDPDFLSEVGENTFYFDKIGSSERMTKYMKPLGWYIVIEERNFVPISVTKNIFPSLVIFLIGISVMAKMFLDLYRKEKESLIKLEVSEHESRTDKLTGLANRRAYEDEKNTMALKAAIPRDWILIEYDLNGLKEINDNKGHLAGDELIINFAKNLEMVYAEKGKVYRIGGDEFVVFFEGVKSEMQELIERAEILNANYRSENIPQISAAMGFAIASEDPYDDIYDLIQLADKRMYEDKNKYYERTGKIKRR